MAKKLVISEYTGECVPDMLRAAKQSANAEDYPRAITHLQDLQGYLSDLSTAIGNDIKELEKSA